MAKPQPQPSKLLSTLVQRGTHASGSVVNPNLLVDLRLLKTERISDGAEMATYGIDFSKAQRPPRSFLAETVSFSYENDVLQLVFGQRELVGAGLDSALVIRMPGAAARDWLGSMETMNPSVGDYAVKLGTPGEKFTELTSNPRQMAKLGSNVVHVSMIGHETCLDFYQASPFAMSESRRTKMLELEPIVRVDLKTSQFITVFNALYEIKSKLPVDK